MNNKGIRTLTWVVQPSEAAVYSIEAFLRERGCSHHVLTHLKRTDHGILLNGEWAYANQRVCPGDTITVRLEETDTSSHILPVQLPLSIIYEDDDILIIDKPSDMPVHPSIGNYENTLANAVMYYYASREIPFVFRCVTRLDRDTTGLAVIAKNMLSSAILSAMSAKRQIHREYLAITEGVLPAEGTIDAPIARQEDSVLMRCVDYKNGERAVTHYRSLGYYIGSDSIQPLPSELTLASVRLETGRTHQIRVHMKSIGHPLPGDFLYNPESVCALAQRQML
ncbi:MAG: RluA family pseudouridine synthase, partial [Lachnospiraceae bacterium]|nr:RluA family pseudouridine synthase [Lachnospiraceae bacterium]